MKSKNCLLMVWSFQSCQYSSFDNQSS